MSALTVVESEALGRTLPTLRTYAQLQALPPVNWSVKGLLREQGLGILYGAPGSGKTFLVLDLALHLASGLDWFGHRTRLPRPVAYIALEAGAGIASRLQAWVDAAPGRSIPDNLKVISGDPLDLLDPDNVEDFAKAIAEQAPGALVIIDTLNRAMPGADENSGQDMGLAVAGAARIADMAGGFVLLVHHAGKDSSKGARGHSSLRAAVDLEIEVARSAGVRTWAATKVKDGAETAAPFAFKLRGVTLGIDPDGDPITSCCVEWDLQGAAQQALQQATKGLGAAQLTVFQNLQGLLVAEGQEVDGRLSVPEGRLLDVCRSELTGEGKDARRVRSRVKEALATLEKRGTVVRSGTALRPGEFVSLPPHLNAAGAGRIAE